MEYLNFNDNIFPAEQPLLPATSRALKFGDGFFETIAIIEKKIPFLHDHFRRLKNSAEILQIQLPKFFTESFLHEKILHVSILNKTDRWATARVQIFRNGEGKYAPQTNAANFIIEVKPDTVKPFNFNRKGLRAVIFNDLKKAADTLSNLKTSNALISVLAANFAKNKGADESFLKNTHGNICEATSSNIFIVKKKKIFTPPLSEGCVDGVMRKNVLKIAKDTVGKIEKTHISVKDLLNADEIFLTNAVTGIKWVKECEGKFFKRDFSFEISNILRKKFFG